MQSTEIVSASYLQYLQAFHQKCNFIPVIHGFLGPAQKSLAIWPIAALWAILEQCGNNWLKEIRSGPVESLIKRLWASQTSEKILYNTKVVPFKQLILKSANKIKIRLFWPSYDPSKEVCFSYFLGFTYFERALTLLLVNIILNFKNCKKALFKLFPNPW